ncbi:hypothetical protein Poly41_59050 [Novipirellula artificiosorum]|uniref:Uncharacterized protein n=1 Tax=Novipirellula artificiosorum TaxID=2528016 RepID=A0A5C6D8I7_9BACT|nr:hypothetical protein Poly41_59050 [Novipirellula artificiosorum]
MRGVLRTPIADGLFGPITLLPPPHPQPFSPRKLGEKGARISGDGIATSRADGFWLPSTPFAAS